MKNELFFTWLEEDKLRNQLILKVKLARLNRTLETQKEVAEILEISLTKVKEIENGKCKDFNAINNYINYFGESIL